MTTAAPTLVVVAGSWGGVEAAGDLLARMTRPPPIPVLLVLHRHPASDGDVIARLVAARCRLDVVEVGDKWPLESGRVHLAPADYHVLVEEGWVSLSVEGPVNHSRPSIDIAFETAAAEHGAGLVAVVLTGAGRDGAAGVVAVKSRGGRVLVQDPAQAARPEMPTAAVATGAVDTVAPLPELGDLLQATVAGAVR